MALDVGVVTFKYMERLTGPTYKFACHLAEYYWEADWQFGEGGNTLAQYLPEETLSASGRGVRRIGGVAPRREGGGSEVGQRPPLRQRSGNAALQRLRGRWGGTDKRLIRNYVGSLTGWNCPLPGRTEREWARRPIETTRLILDCLAIFERTSQHVLSFLSCHIAKLIEVHLTSNTTFESDPAGWTSYTLDLVTNEKSLGFDLTLAAYKHFVIVHSHNPSLLETLEVHHSKTLLSRAPIPYDRSLRLSLWRPAA